MNVLDRRLFVRGGVVAAMASVGVLATLRLANAIPGGGTRPSLSFSGTLQGATGPQTLTFAFKKAGATVCAPTAMATPGASGQFTTEVSIGAPCPVGLFDGGDVTFDISVGSTVVVRDRPVNPVPYARYADQSGVGNDCPAGYALEATATPGIVCVRTVTPGGMALRDEVVKVGTGGSAFWVDRYEASIHQVSTGAQFGTATASAGGADNIAMTGLSESGQRPLGVQPPAVAVSHVGFPSVLVSWFQANESCRAAGKRLPTGSEWQAAAGGTIDGATCNVSSSGARASAPTNGCVSAAGAHDMIGNIFELTDEWYTSVGHVTSTGVGPGSRVGGVQVNSQIMVWPSSYGNDGTWNVTSTVWNESGIQNGIPAVASRGGHWAAGAQAGVFALNLNEGPSSRNVSAGFRCVVPR